MTTLPPSRSILTFGLCAVLTFVLDRITKYAALTYLQTKAIAIFPGFSLQLALNSGISFSFFATAPVLVITTMVAVVSALLIVAWRFSATNRVTDVAYGCIIGGAIGNFVDRLFYGAVVDFIDLFYKNWHWPTFNIADIAISIGFVLLARELWHE